MAAKPFESRIQNLVYNVDVGIGLRLIKGGLYVLFIFITMLLYTATQFHGLKNPDAMDCAQIARQVAARGHFETYCVRPASMWYLINHTRTHDPRLNNHPDILHAPLWPLTLAAVFKTARVSFPVDTAPRIFPPEQWVIIPLCHLFSLLTGVLVYLLGRTLFDRRTAFLGMTIYFLSDAVWSTSISGLSVPMATFLTTAAIFLALIAVIRRQEEESQLRWLIPLAGSVVLCALAFLTRYATAVVVPALAVFVGVSFPKKGWTWAGGFVLAFLILISPWLARNQVVSGGLLGLAPYTALNETPSYEDNNFERTLAPAVNAGRVIGDLRSKGMTNFKKIYSQTMRSVGDGLFVSLFLAAFFYRFIRNPVHRLRWCLALAFFLLMVVASIWGDETVRLFHLFWPFIIVYGLAFFFILLDRLQLRVRLFELGVTTAVVALGALPLVFTMMPPRSGVPYPPYFPPFVMHVSKLLTPQEMMCTDIPWATAWYGNRRSLLMPVTTEDFFEISDYNKLISGLYITTVTRDKPYVKNLLTGPDKSWFPILEGRIPNDFTLNQGFPLNNMDQIFLTDRVRWKE